MDTQLQKEAVNLFGQFLSGQQISTLPADLNVYGQDWSKIGVPAPLMVLFPKSTQEVSRILKLCSEKNWNILPSGGRTGLSGGALASKGEIVLSLEKMNHIGEPKLLSRSLRVQAGAITKAVHDVCHPFGLTWPVDFASKGSSQVGGNLATNAGGINVIRFGNTRNWVLSLEVVLMNGEVLELNKNLEKNNTGYDLKNLMIGSEGTLGVITAATLRLAPLDKNKRLVLMSLRSMREVAEVFESCHRHSLSLSAFEYMSRKSYLKSLNFCAMPDPLGDLPEDIQALAVVEIVGSSSEEWLAEVLTTGRVQNAIEAQSSSQSDALWKVREAIAESVMREALVHQHDVSVPIEALVDFASTLETFYSEKYPQFEVFIFGHIGDGNLHIFIRKPEKMEQKVFENLCLESDKYLYEYIQKFEGSTSAEHGIGLWKKPGLLYSRSKAEIEVMRSIKKAFDPKNLLNPGKIFDQSV